MGERDKVMVTVRWDGEVGMNVGEALSGERYGLLQRVKGRGSVIKEGMSGSNNGGGVDDSVHCRGGNDYGGQVLQ